VKRWEGCRWVQSEFQRDWQVYPLGTSSARAYVHLDALTLSPTRMLGLAGACEGRAGRGWVGGGAGLAGVQSGWGAEGGRGGRRGGLAAYSVIMSTALELLPAARALSLADALLVAAACAPPDADDAWRGERWVTGKRKAGGLGGARGKGASGGGTDTPGTTLGRDVQEREREGGGRGERGQVYVAGIRGAEVECGHEFASVTGAWMQV